MTTETSKTSIEAKAGSSLATQGGPSHKEGDRQRFVAALQKEFDHSRFGSFNLPKKNQAELEFSCGKNGTRLKECMYNGKAAVDIRIDSKLYTKNGKVDKGLRQDLYVEAFAKYRIALAEAKYADDPAKGLAELKNVSKFWFIHDGHKEGSAVLTHMDKLTVKKIESLLLEKEKSLEKASTDQPAHASSQLETADKKADKPSSSAVEKARAAIGSDRLQKDATKLSTQKEQTASAEKSAANSPSSSPSKGPSRS